jgi:hypothetical protein
MSSRKYQPSKKYTNDSMRQKIEALFGSFNMQLHFNGIKNAVLTNFFKR